MRVLFLCHRQHDLTVGGVAEFLQHLPSALKKQNVESVIYTQSDTSTNELLGPTFLKTTPCYAGPFLKPGWFLSRAKIKPLLQLCEQEKINIIHAQGLYRSGYMAMQIYKRIAIPYLITSHSDNLACNSERIKRYSVRHRCRTILKNAASVTHLTPFMANASHEIFNTAKKSMIIGNGIDITNWKAFTHLPKKNYITAIGRLEHEKGFGIVIEAYANLLKHPVDTSLIIAGTGSAEIELQNQARQLGLTILTNFNDFSHIPSRSIIFTGYVRGDTKKQLLAQTQLLLFATQPDSWEEAFGIVQIEAMAAGTAMIASDSPVTRYLQKKGLQTLLISPKDVTAWTNGIHYLLNNSVEREQMGEINRKNAGLFDWEIIAEQYKNVYSNVLSLNKR